MTGGSRAEALDGKFELGALFEFSRIVNESLDLKFILGHLLLTLMGKLLVLKGIVLLEQAPDRPVQPLPGRLGPRRRNLPEGLQVGDDPAGQLHDADHTPAREPGRYHRVIQ